MYYFEGSTGNTRTEGAGGKRFELPAYMPRFPETIGNLISVQVVAVVFLLLFILKK